MPTKITLDRPGLSGATLYATLDSAAGRWNGAGFEPVAAANWAAYAVPLAEAAGTGHFEAYVPAAIDPTTPLAVTVRRQAGGAPAPADKVAGSGAVRPALVAVAGFGGHPDLLDGLADVVGKLQGDYADAEAGGLADLNAGVAAATRGAFVANPVPAASVVAGVTLAAPALSADQSAAILQIPGLVEAVDALPATGGGSGGGLTPQQAAAILLIPGLVEAVDALPTTGGNLTPELSAAILQIPGLVQAVDAIPTTGGGSGGGGLTPAQAAQLAALAAIDVGVGAVQALPAPGPGAFCAAPGAGLLATSGAYDGQWVVFRAPGLLRTVRRQVLTHRYNAAASPPRHEFALARPLPSAPAAGDPFLVE